MIMVRTVSSNVDIDGLNQDDFKQILIQSRGYVGRPFRVEFLLWMLICVPHSAVATR